MIIRIQGEGQFRLPDDAIDELNRLDAALEAALKTAEDDFVAHYDAVLDFVRANGAALDPTELVESDVVLPPADSTEEEVRSLLTEEGLIPG
jgi:hypothetical protein